MVLEYLLLLIGFSGLVFASITDLKTREVPDMLNYGLMIIGAFIHILNSILKHDFTYLMPIALGFIAFFLVANLMYFTKQWGGGDAKLLMACAIIFSSYPAPLLKVFSPNLPDIPFLLIYFLNLLIIGAIYGLAYTVYISLKSGKALRKDFLLALTEKANLMFITLAFSLAILSFFVFSSLSTSKFAILVPPMLLLLFPILTIFVKAVEKNSMFIMLDISKVTEGDWVAKDILLNGKKVYSANSPGITKAQIAILKKSNIKRVLVKQGIPFVPSFLLSTIFTLIVGFPVYF